MEWNISGQDFVTFSRLVGAALAMGLAAVGSAMGIGLAAVGALKSMVRQPERQGEFVRTMFISQAVAESTAIYGLVVAMLLLFTTGGGQENGFHGSDWVNGIRLLAAGLTMGLGAIGAGYGIGIAGTHAIEAITQRPELRGVFMRTMFLGMAITESPAIYALVISMILIFVMGAPDAVGMFSANIMDIARYMGAGLAMGAGAIGAAIGIGTAAAKALTAIARQPAKQGPLIRTMFLSMAITESPAIYALVVSSILIFVFIPTEAEAVRVFGGMDLVAIGKYLGGAIAIGFGTIGAGIGLGIAGGGALDGIARNPQKESSLVRTMFLSMAITESPAIYALVISLILLFVFTVPDAMTWGQGWAELAKLLGGGIAIGLGTIGAGAGVGIAGLGGLIGIARRPQKEGAMLRTMFIGMGVTESPTIYALVVSLILLFVASSDVGSMSQGIHDFARFLGAGFAMGAGAIGPGLGIGMATRDALTSMAKQPKHEGALVRTMFLGMAVTESTAIYALVVSLILLFAVG